MPLLGLFFWQLLASATQAGMQQEFYVAFEVAVNGLHRGYHYGLLLWAKTATVFAHVSHAGLHEYIQWNWKIDQKSGTTKRCSILDWPAWQCITRFSGASIPGPTHLHFSFCWVWECRSTSLCRLGRLRHRSTQIIATKPSWYVFQRSGRCYTVR